MCVYVSRLKGGLKGESRGKPDDGVVARMTALRAFSLSLSLSLSLDRSIDR